MGDAGQPEARLTRRQALRAGLAAAAAGSVAVTSGAAATVRQRFAGQRRALSAGGPGSLRVVWQVELRERVVALSFDDGPSRTWTPRLLDQLGELGVPATFFLVGRAARSFPDLVARMAAEGHEIGNHSDTHANLGTAPASTVTAELGRCQRTLSELTGVRPALVRPPYGAVSGAVLRAVAELDCDLALWTFALTQHDRGRTGLVEQVQSRLRPGAVVLAHDAGDSRRELEVDAVPGIVQAVHAAGYRLTTVGNLLELAGQQSSDAGGQRPRD